MKNGKNTKKYIGILFLILVGYGLYSSGGLQGFGQASFTPNGCKAEMVSVDATFTPVVRAYYDGGAPLFDWQRLQESKSFSLDCGEKATILSCRASIINNECTQQASSYVVTGDGKNSCISVDLYGTISGGGC